jgi:tetratricopeptide (TPR) repeat protein
MAIVPSLYGGGNHDTDLSRADDLIRNKQYDEAILLLSGYIKDHPDNFSHAQRRLQQIIKIRGEYNTVAEELLDTVVNDPDNAEKILVLIRRLEAVESSQNLQVQSFIARTQDLAQFAYNRDRLRAIFAEAQALVEAGRFYEALQAYSGGLDIYRDEFFASGYGEIIENRVVKGIEDITGGIASFPSITAPLSAIAAEMVQAGQHPDPYDASNISRMADIYDRLVPALDRLIAFQQTLYITASYFDEQLARLQQADPAIGDRSFLSFASRLIRGGSEISPTDGMAGAVEGYWQTVIGGAERTVAELTDGLYSEGLLYALNWEYGSAIPAFESAGSYVRYPLAFIDKRREFREGNGLPGQRLFDQQVLINDTELFLKYQSMNRAIRYFIGGAELGNRHERSRGAESDSVEAWRQGRISSGEAMARENLSREGSGGLLTEIDALLTEISTEQARLRNYRDNFEDPESRSMDILQYVNSAYSVIGVLRNHVFEQELETLSRFFTIANGDFEQRLTSRRTEYDEGNRLIQGIPRADDSEGANVDHYPAEGLAILTRMEEEIAADTERGAGLLNQYAGEREELRIYQENFENPEDRNMDVLQYVNSAYSVIGALRAQVFDRELESASRFYTIANGEFERRLISRKAEYDEANRFIQGIPRDESGGGANVERYPAEGLAVLARMEEGIAADVQRGANLLDQYAGERGEILSSEAVSVLHASARAMVDELAAVRLQGQRAAAAVRTQIAQAETFRLDGDRFYREARNALTQNNFDVARDRLQRATERFNASLAIQESVSLRTEWDTRLVNLGDEINRIENEIVIRDVRNLVNTARDAYFTGNFEQAESLLVRAQNRWKRTNVGDDSEVLYWLNVIRGALTLRSGRVIPPTAPLYAEMSQLLSEAKKNYEEGVRYLNANQRIAGIAKFTEARQKTQEVKLMFPVNQEAGILELRIDQMVDQRAFDASFERRFNNAVAGTKPGVRSLESFAELQNLAEINPQYPGMAAALVQAEIDMGYRPPSPNPQDIARSNDLTAAARVIIAGNITVQFEVALRQLNEALTLNPNNTQAMTLKDQVQTRMSGTGTVVIDSRSEALYGQAVSEFQRGNYLIASGIVEQLLQNPKNRSSTRILELQRRIQSRL